MHILRSQADAVAPGAWFRLAGLPLALLAVVWTAGCGAGTQRPSDGDRMVAFTSIEPVAHIVRRVGGTELDVHVLVPDGQDPHTFQPTPQQMTALAGATLYFRVGLPLEDRLLEQLRQSHPSLVVVDTTEGIQKRTTACGAGCTHHGHHHDHDHNHAEATAAADPHVWLAPQLLRIQAANIAGALQKADPEHAQQYATNLEALTGELDALDATIGRRLEPYRGRGFYVFHSSYGYFAEAYGLRQEAVEIEGKKPTPKQLRALIEKARADEVRVVFAQPQFDQRSAEVVAEAIGATVVAIDPLAEDVLQNLDRMSERIAAALAKP